MPFTPSHVAAILPFVRTPLLPAALATGAMAPDLFTYLPLPVTRDFAHSWLGVLTVDLAFGVVVYLLWQLVFRRPVVNLGPLWVRQRVGPADWMPTTRARWLSFALLLAASILLGSTTHVLWDLVTHPGAPGAGYPALARDLGPLTGYDWLQYGSSLIGLLVLAWFVRRWWRRTPAREPAASPISARFRQNALLIAVAVGIVVAVAEWLLFFGRGPGGVDSVIVSHLVTSWLSGAGPTAIVICLIWLFRARAARL